MVYKDTVDVAGVQPHPDDSALLQAILAAVLQDDRSGVTTVHVNPYQLVIRRSMAVSTKQTIDRIRMGVKTLGLTAHITCLDKPNKVNKPESPAHDKG